MLQQLLQPRNQHGPVNVVNLVRLLLEYGEQLSIPAVVVRLATVMVSSSQCFNFVVIGTVVHKTIAVSAFRTSTTHTARRAAHIPIVSAIEFFIVVKFFAHRSITFLAE